MEDRRGRGREEEKGMIGRKLKDSRGRGSEEEKGKKRRERGERKKIGR